MVDQTNNFKDAINLLDNFSQEHLIFETQLLSTGETIRLKHLKTKQQKNILNAAIEASSELYKFTFPKDVYNILLENCENRDLVNSFSSLDRQYLTLILRSHVSDSISLTEENETQTFSLKEIISKFEDFKHPSTEVINLLQNNIEVEVEVAVPSFKLEIDYINALPNFEVKESEKETLKTLITETYIYEISKYIKEIKIGGKDLNYSGLGINQKYTITEKLPVNIAQMVIAKISKWKNLINERLTVTFKSGNTRIIEPDALMFLTN
jgi:hypothetical protein